VETNENASEIEAKVHDRNGIRDVLVRCTDIQSSGPAKRFLLVLTDITRLKRLEQIRTDFVANVSHELKTPVTSIKGFTETLLDGALDDRDTARHFLEIMDAQSGRLINIIEDLLTLSRLEQESKPPETAPADLAEIMRKVCRTWEKNGERKNISIVFREPDPDADFTVSVNTGLIQQAVGNILDNAVKYCPPGSEVVCMIGRETAGGKNVACIGIEDNGNGIPSIYRERIFERFFRVDKGRSRETGGTGLGLSITAHIIKIHGGTVEETERPDGKPGAYFRIILPLPELPAV
jgi:two-component system phosphate regulon sensor histidine kinase PhoR